MNLRLNMFLTFLLIVVILFFFNCKKQEVLVIVNSKPRYDGKKYIKLEKQFSIDVTEINLFTKRGDYYGCYDFDSKDNLYILDTFEGTISVYDKNGELISKFGGLGQGPNEFLSPNLMLIKKDKIYVMDGFFDLKVLNLQGQVIKKYNIQIFWENPVRWEAVSDRFYLLKCKVDLRTFNKLELILNGELDDRFSGGKELWRYKYPYGFKGYPCWEWLLILDSGEFFFPEDNHNKYLITKYDKKGKPLLKFGRKYKKIYKVSPIRVGDYRQFIEVYKIKYLLD